MNLREDQRDILTEYLNIGMGRAAATLNNMLGSPIRLQVPRVSVVPLEDAAKNLAEMGTGDFAAVCMKFTGNFKGSAALMFPSASAATLLKLLNQDTAPGSDMNAMKSGVLTEVGNIVLNALMGSIVNLMKERLEFVVPFYSEDTPAKIVNSMMDSEKDTHLIMARTSFQVEHGSVDGCAVIVFEISFMSKLAEALDRILQSA